VRTQLFFRGEAGPRAPRCPLKLRASPPMAPTVQTAKRGTVWPFGRLEHWWLESAPKLGCDGAVTTHK